jgi:NitT/TauT family transport system substrate-binding protein
MRLTRFNLSITTVFLAFWILTDPGICATKASLLPQWIPQAQFAGYMVALDKGFYRNQGIELDLLKGGPERPALDQLQKGECTFATAWLSTGIQQRSSGARIVNLAQIVQRSALMLVARKSSGIKAPADLQGKKLGLWGGDFRIQPLAFFLQNKVQVDIVPLYGTPNLFLKGAVDAMSAMWYNEYHQVLLSGIDPDELTTFFFSDSALNFPEDGIYCLEETYLKDPELCNRFVKASLEGWLYAFDHQQEALDIVIKYAHAANTGTNPAHQRWMLERMRDLIIPGGNRSNFGKLRPEDYSSVAKVLQRLGLIQSAPSFADFYKGTK